MATIEYEEIDNWFELSSTIDDKFTHFNNYIFRGQADAKWKLESTLARSLKKKYEKSSDKKEATEKHLKRFKENIRGRTSVDLISASDVEIWALGQHFGLYTPLLDWTRSPYVALFFSLFGPCESKKRSLWAIVEEDIDGINVTKKSDINSVHIFSPLTHHNERLVNQRGIFLNIPIGIELENWVKKAKDQGWVTMYKIVFPDSIRNDALSALNNMNINHLSLFPDLNGASLCTNYQLEIEPFLLNERNKLWKKSSASI